MTKGLRAIQREQREAEIIESAKKLFRSNGYKRTSIEMIATEAKVGVATIYNYFGNKPNILKKSAEPQLQTAFLNGQDIIDKVSSNPSKETYKLLHCYLHIGDKWTDKKLLRLFLLPASNEHNNFFAEMRITTENAVQSQLQDLFKALVKIGKLSKETNVRNLSKIVFAIFNQQHINCILEDRLKPSDAYKEIEKQLGTLFNEIKV